MTDSNELRAAFILFGFRCDPDDITRELSIEPTTIIRRGEEVGKHRIRAKENIWRLESALSETTELEPHFYWLLDRLPPTLESLSVVGPDAKAQFAVAVHIHKTQGPSIALSEVTIMRTAALNASLDIDLYCR